MTAAMDCSEARLSLGVYVLGAIDPAERTLVDSHLTGCRDCRDELAGLAGLPALLDRVSMEEAIALGASDVSPFAGEDLELSPPPALATAVVDLTAARRRRRTWREVGLGVAAALIIAAGVFSGLSITATPSSPPVAGIDTTHSVGPAGPWQNATGRSGNMIATVDYRQVGWGTQFTAKVTGVPIGTKCTIWAVGPSNRRDRVGTWIVDGDEGDVWYPGSTWIAAAQVQEFVVTVGTTKSITAES